MFRREYPNDRRGENSFLMLAGPGGSYARLITITGFVSGIVDRLRHRRAPLRGASYRVMHVRKPSARLLLRAVRRQRVPLCQRARMTSFEGLFRTQTTP